MGEVYIALGSNLDDRLAWLRQARERVGGLLTGLRTSSIYETDSVGYEQQPRYLNAVVAGTTDLTPLDLLHMVQLIEADLGRVRPFPNAPRTIDLDLLLYDELMLDTPELILPHPRLHERFFVLVPLAELASGLRHPRFNQTIGDLLRTRGSPTGIERVTDDTMLSQWD